MLIKTLKLTSCVQLSIGTSCLGKMAISTEAKPMRTL